jgi:hypothetical protein
MMITLIALVSRAKMAEFRAKRGGVTFEALDEIVLLDWGGTWEIAKYQPGISGHRPGWEPVDSDHFPRRLRRRVLRQTALCPAAGWWLRLRTAY